MLKRRTFFKVQMSFVEELCIKSQSAKLKSLISGTGGNSRIKLLFPDEYVEYSTAVSFETYDVKEVLSEKFRAILTRRGVKARDYLDIFFISKRSGIKPGTWKSVQLKKSIAVLDYTKNTGITWRRKRRS